MLAVTPKTTVRLPVGSKVKLSAKQYASRKHLILALSEGVYEVTEPIQFKANDSFFVDTSGLPKSVLCTLSEAAP